MHSTVRTWLDMTREQLDEVYCNSAPGALPAGDTRGTAILAGSLFSKTVAAFVRLFAWQGKVFDLFCPEGRAGVLVNKILPLGMSFIVAKVYVDKSWLDGKDTIVIDYSSTSVVAKVIRDEIREVEPGVYIGKVWWGKTRILDFALTRATQD